MLVPHREDHINDIPWLKASPENRARSAAAPRPLAGRCNWRGSSRRPIRPVYPCRNWSQLTGVNKSTIHRLLQELLDGGLVSRSAGKRYRLGRFAFEMGVVASAQYGVREACAA